MVELIWTEPALSDLDAIADYIALENPEAARSLVQRVFQHVEELRRMRRVVHGPENCAVHGIGRSLSRHVGYSIVTTASESLSYTSCEGKCAYERASLAKEIDRHGRLNRT